MKFTTSSPLQELTLEHRRTRGTHHKVSLKVELVEEGVEGTKYIEINIV